MLKLVFYFFVVATINTVGFSQTQDFNATNSASYGKGVTVGFSTLFANLGKPFTNSRCIADSPNTKALCGTEVLIKGTLEEERATLVFVSPFQLNIVIPQKFYGDTIQIKVKSQIGEQSSLFIVGNNPGVFTANGSGTGQLAAVYTYDGVSYYPTYYFDTNLGVFIGLTVDSVYNGKQNYLILYGTGLKTNTKVAFVNGNHTHISNVEYCGGTFIDGLDQVNVKVPRLPQGNWLVFVISDGVISNAGNILLSGN
ncbi:MAG TPA: hypothetical protein PLP33_24960 [Leptospiraceae bacterium]|nr:hypothetical protein [Leptospiraceae bacterium]